MSKKMRLMLGGGALGLVLICCVAGILFLIWTSQPANQAAFQATDAAAAVKNTQSAATATAESQALDARLASATPVFTETFEANSAFLKTNIGDLSLTMRDGVPEISLAFAATHIWTSGQQRQDFVAELDCSPVGTGTFCGLAFGVHQKNAQASAPDFYYASYIAPSGSCGFSDYTGGFSADKTWSCNPPPTPANSALNRLRVERAGNRLRFYVNGALMDDRALSNPDAQSGDVAVYFGRASGDTSGIATVQLDNFKIWTLPPGSP
jgi:hypothetical protein